MKLTLDLFGSICNEYPVLTIIHNDHIVFSGTIVENSVVEIDMLLEDTNLIRLYGIGKSNGEVNKWDTLLSSDGSILKDKYLKINNIRFDDISMGAQWINSLSFKPDHSPTYHQFYGWYENGSIEFSIDLPLLDWIIQEKFIKFEQSTATATPTNARSGEIRFDYEYIQNKINLIKKILND
jgi:hypothetical protein